MLNKIKTVAVAVCLSLSALPTMAQDLLAKQAPIDKKMKAVDSVALSRLIQYEQTESPSADLYDEWENRYAHKATALPDSFNINLRDFCMPTTNRVVTSNFGARWGRQHKGIDVKVYIGDTIRAAFSGKVRIVRYEARGYGKYVVIRHHNGLETIYGHMSKHLVAENDEVKAGDPIGLGGNTGRSTGSHLHFETRLCGVALNPALMFDFRNQDVVDDYYMFRKNKYEQESVVANQLRGKIGNGGYVASDVRGETIPGKRNVEAKNKNAEIRYHKVAVGETLYSIAKRRKVTVDELCRMNHLTRDIKVRPGQLLRYS